MKFLKKLFPSEDQKKVDHLQQTVFGIDNLIVDLNTMRMGAKDLKRSGVKFIRNDNDKELDFPKVSDERVFEIVTYNRQIKKIIEKRIESIREKCAETLELTQKSKKNNSNVVMHLNTNGEHTFTRNFKDRWEQIVTMQAETVLLDSLVQAEDIAGIRNFIRNSIVSGVFGGSLIENLSKKPVVHLPIVFDSGFDYFDRPDLFQFDPTIS